MDIVDDCDVICVAKNEALLDGLLTVFHVERSSDELLNLQNDLPLLSEYDKECLISLAAVSFLCLERFSDDLLCLSRFVLQPSDKCLGPKSLRRISTYISNPGFLLCKYREGESSMCRNLLQDYEIDFISLSYTRTVDDVIEARAFLDAVGLQNTKIFAKLESRQSLLNFKGILNEADGVIISRYVKVPVTSFSLCL